MTNKTNYPTHNDAPLPLEPGHVRARQHYEAMLAERMRELGRQPGEGAHA